MALIRKTVVIDHNEAMVYCIADELLGVKSFTPNDDFEINHRHRHQKNSHYEGQNVPDDKPFYTAVAQSLKDADEILLISHGKGRSSAGVVFIKFLSQHYPNLLPRIVGIESLEQMTNQALIDHSRYVFSNAEHRKRLGLSD